MKYSDMTTAQRVEWLDDKARAFKFIMCNCLVYAFFAIHFVK